MTGKMGLTLLALLLGAGIALADAPTLHRTTAAGQPVKIHDHVKLGSSCGGTGPDISFGTPPAHGTTEIKPSRFVFHSGYVNGAARACEGHEVDGVAIWYTPAAGFHGVDRFSWTTDFGGRGKNRRVDNYTAEVTVQ